MKHGFETLALHLLSHPINWCNQLAVLSEETQGPSAAGVDGILAGDPVDRRRGDGAVFVHAGPGDGVRRSIVSPGDRSQRINQ